MNAGRRYLAVPLVALFAICSVTSATDASDRCQKKGLRIAGRYANCRLRAEALGLGKHQFPDYTSCEQAFNERVTETADTGNGSCLIQGEAQSLRVIAAESVARISSLLATVRYEDTGLGSVIDHHTGLEWQKTDDRGGLTDKDNIYTWSDGTSEAAPTGTAFTEFLGKLNAGYEQFDDDGPKTIGCYAGHCDWRIPLIEEWTTIIDCTFGPPCMDESVFGPINAEYIHWSATTLARASDRDVAWDIDFWRGRLSSDAKYGGGFVRAVRRRW